MAILSVRRHVTPRDIDILTALSRCPLTAEQLLKLSVTFGQPFTSLRRMRERLQQLTAAGWLRSWPYATTSRGGPPHYWKLARDGYRLLYGTDATLPARRLFGEIGIAHQHHTRSLADFVVHTLVAAHRAGIAVRYFAPENSARIEVGGTCLYPDCAFQLVPAVGRAYNFVVEMDNGTERVRSAKDVESLERKIRLYDQHQARFPAYDARRYVVLFVTTRSAERLRSILDAAAHVAKNPHRRLFLATDLATYLRTNDPLRSPCFQRPIGKPARLVELSPRESQQNPARRRRQVGELVTTV